MRDLRRSSWASALPQKEDLPVDDDCNAFVFLAEEGGGGLMMALAGDIY